LKEKIDDSVAKILLDILS